jgi:hypothetical protein
MMVFQVVGGHFYEGSETVGIYSDKDNAINAAKTAFAGQDWGNDNDRCFDFVEVVEVMLDKKLATDIGSQNKRSVFKASKND